MSVRRIRSLSLRFDVLKPNASLMVTNSRWISAKLITLHLQRAVWIIRYR